MFAWNHLDGFVDYSSVVHDEGGVIQGLHWEVYVDRGGQLGQVVDLVLKILEVNHDKDSLEAEAAGHMGFGHVPIRLGVVSFPFDDAT